VLERGLERGSEELGQELGLVRASDFPHLVQGLTPTSQITLTDDLHALAPDVLMTYVPREADGRLPLKRTVLLTRYDAQRPQSQHRQMWLVACTPQRQRDPQVVTLTLASLIGVYHASRWDQARWLWDSRHQAASAEERWGVSGLVLEHLGLAKRAEHLAFYTERCAQAEVSLADRVSLCLLLQDEGRLEEAFALFGIELSLDALKILYKHPLSLHTYNTTKLWFSALREVLTLAAPWRFASLPASTHHCLCVLPHQLQQRKACLILVTPNKRQKAGTPSLLIEETTSNTFLPHVAWQRSKELDLMRFQIS
jgi:hypothetical protein